MDDTSPQHHVPRAFGGYRLGRRLAEGHYLGHLDVPSVVELVFLDDIPNDMSRESLARAVDVVMGTRGERVAILEHRAVETERFRLETPPELAQTWLDMERRSSSDMAGEAPRQMEKSPSVVERAVVWWRSRKRGPLIIAALAGVGVVIAATSLWPQSDQTTQMATQSQSLSQSVTPGTQAPTAIANVQNPEIPGVESTLEPESTAGDVAVVRLPGVAANPGTPPAEQLVVLERDGSTWRIRDVY